MPTSNQKKIRDLQRLLKSKGDSLDEEGRASILKRIDDLQNTKVAVKEQEIKRKHEHRYHMVKFFEKKKVLRMIASVDKQLCSAGDGESASLQDKRRKLVDDLTYILYYPIEMKYTALFAGSDNENEHDDKSARMAEKARALALQARLADQTHGREDKVESALQCTLHKPESSSSRPTSDKPAQSRSARTLPSPQSSNRQDKKATREDDDDEEEDDEEEEDEEDEEDEEKEEEDGKEERGHRRPTPSSTPNASTPVAHKPVLPDTTDAFFLEEAPAEDLAHEDDPSTHTGAHIHRPQSSSRSHTHSASQHFKQAYQQVRQAANKRKFANHQSLRQVRGPRREQHFGGGRGQSTGGRGYGGGRGGGRGGSAGYAANKRQRFE